MGFIYPDNDNRANRVQQLAINIGSIQSEADDSLKRVDTATKHQLDAIDELLRLEGFTKIEDLAEQIRSMMTDEQRAAYDEQVKHIKDQNETTDTILQASSAVAFIAGVSRLGAAPVARVLGTGALAAGADLFGRGFRAMLSGDEAGIAMMRAAFRTFRALSVGGEVSETASKIARIVRTAGAVLSILGVVLDGIVLVYAAIEGAKQKEELQQGIKELCARRFQVKQLEDQLFATEAYTGQVSAYLVTYNVLKSKGQDPDSIKTIMDALLKNVVDNLQQDLDAITDTMLWNQCQDIDKQTSNAWTNEDPSLDWVKTWIQSQPALVPDEDKSAVAKSVLSAMEVRLPEKGIAHTN